MRHCPECAAAWHPDCGAVATRPRCPTIGCTGPAPNAQVRNGKRRGPAPSPRDAASPLAERPGRRPVLAARLGPYVRLVVSGVVTTLLLAAATAFLLWPVLGTAGFWKAMSTGKRGSHVPWPVALLESVMFLVLAGVCVWLSARWLLRLPSVWRELGQLLDDTSPTAMRLGIYTTGSGKSKKRWARLTPLSGHRSQELTLRLDGILPPGWLGSRDGARVLVYGLPPPGPYVFEFEDGWLALVHPDD